MSIYATTFSVGYPEDEDTPGVVLIRDDGNNHYPDPETWRRGAIDGAEIPGSCVPGHENDGAADDNPGNWYRLSGCSIRTVPEFPDRPQLWSDQEYVLDEDAARALRDDLTRWLDHPKTRKADA